MGLTQQVRSLASSLSHSKFVQRIIPPEEVAGLEITEEAIRLLYFYNKGGTAEWDYYSFVPLPKGVVSASKIQNGDALASQINKLYTSIVADKKLGTDVVISVPEQHVYLQPLKVPVEVPESAVAGVILNNPSVVFPYPVHEIYFAWQTIDIVGLDRRILLIMMPRSLVEQFQGVVENAGLQPIALQTPTLGFEFSLQFPEGISIVYFLEKSVFTAAVYMKGKLFFKRTSSLIGNLPAGVTPDAEAIANLIAKDFRRVKDFALSELGEEFPVSLFLLSYYEGIEQVVELIKKKNLGVPVDKAKIKPMDVPKNVLGMAPWSGVLGAAFRGMVPRRNDIFASLLPFTTREQYIRRRKSVFFSRTTKIVFTILFFYVASFGFMGFFLSSTQRRVQQDMIRQQSVQLPEEVLKIEGEVEKFNATVGNLSAIKRNLHSFLPALKALKAIEFTGITLSQVSMSFQQKKVAISLTGNASTREQFLAFRKFLQDQGIFSDITTPIQNIAARQNINFTMSFFYGS